MRSWKPFSHNDAPAPATSDRPRLFQRVQTRLSGLFQRNPPPDAGNMPAVTPVVPGGIPTKVTEPPLAEPKAGNLYVAPTSFHAVSSGAHGPLSPQMAEKAGHDANFRWITGQLRKEKGGWTIYYSNPEVVDNFGGRLALNASAAQMSPFHDGDLVSAQGRVANRAYHATSVYLIEHETN
jgi:hypothetical protein